MKNHSLFDTHAHYDHPLFEGEGPRVLSDLFNEGIIDGVVIPAITYETNNNRKMFPETVFPNVYFAAGLHPKYASYEPVWDEQKIRDFSMIVEERRTVAIKTGLDFANKKLSLEQKDNQYSYLRLLTQIAEKYSLPIVLHIRDAAEDIIEFLSNQNKVSVEIAVHCFSYDYSIAQRMMEVGITRFGIGGMISRDEMDSLRESIKNIPIESIMLETDSPFVKPKGYHEKCNTSRTLIDTASMIATIKGLDIDSTITMLQRNAKEFFGLKK